MHDKNVIRVSSKAASILFKSRRYGYESLKLYIQPVPQVCHVFGTLVGECNLLSSGTLCSDRFSNDSSQKPARNSACSSYTVVTYGRLVRRHSRTLFGSLSMYGIRENTG